MSGFLCSVLVALVAFGATAVPLAQAAWSSLPSGTTVGRPAVARNVDGRLLVFTVRPDRQIWYTASLVSSPTTQADPETAWGEWQPLGGAFCADSSPIAATDAEGRIYVFGLTCDGRVWHKWQLTIGDTESWPSPWRQPRRTLDQPAVVLAGAPSVLRNLEGRLQLLARLPDGTVATMRQVSPDPIVVWGEWQSLGGDVVGGPSAVANSDGRLEVFVLTADGNVWHSWQLVPAVDAGWSDWHVLPGNLASEPVAALNADGRVEVFAVTPGGYLWHTWQETAGSATWRTWHLLGGEVTGPADGLGDFLHGVEVATGEDGRLGVFVQDEALILWSRWQKTPGSQSWSYWTSVCGESAEVATGLSAAAVPTDLFVRRTDGAVWAKRCDSHCLGEAPRVIPVLNYHGVSEEVPWGTESLFVRPGDFREQLRHLRDEGFTPVQLGDLEQLCEIERPVLLTFDDGLVDNREVLYPILREPEFDGPAFTARAVVSPISIRTSTGNPKFLSVQQIQEMLDRVSFENHTVHHYDLTTLGTEDLVTELEVASADIASWTGLPVKALVYPKGAFDQDVLEATQERFHYGLTTEQGLYRLGQDRYRIPRRFVSRFHGLAEFVSRLTVCAHSEYEIGAALEEGCGGGIPDQVPPAICTVAVCSGAGLTHCCDVDGSGSWDQTCLDSAREVCDLGEP